MPVFLDLELGFNPILQQIFPAVRGMVDSYFHQPPCLTSTRKAAGDVS